MKSKIIYLKDIKKSPEIKTIYKPQECFHGKFVVDINNEIVTCGKCGKEVRAIKVLNMLAQEHSNYFREIENLENKIKELKAWNPHRKIIKRCSEMLTSKMYPECPICSTHFSIEEIDPNTAAGGYFLDEIIKRRMESKKIKKIKITDPATVITKLIHDVISIAKNVYEKNIDGKTATQEIDKLTIDTVTTLTDKSKMQHMK